MVVHGDGQGFLGVFLAHALEVKLALDFCWFGNVDARFMPLGLRGQFLVQHLLAKNHAVVADVHAGSGDELLDFGVGLAAKTAQRDVGWPGH